MPGFQIWLDQCNLNQPTTIEDPEAFLEVSIGLVLKAGSGIQMLNWLTPQITGIMCQQKLILAQTELDLLKGVEKILLI